MTIDKIQRIQRQEHVRQAMANAQLEGITFPEEIKQLFSKYIDGELTIEKVIEKIGLINADPATSLNINNNTEPSKEILEMLGGGKNWKEMKT